MIAKNPGKVAPRFELEKNPPVGMQVAIVQAGRKQSELQLSVSGLGSLQHPLVGKVVMPYGFMPWSDSATTLPTSGRETIYLWTVATAVALKRNGTWSTVQKRRDVLSYEFVRAHFSDADMKVFDAILHGLEQWAPPSVSSVMGVDDGAGDKGPSGGRGRCCNCSA